MKNDYALGLWPDRQVYQSFLGVSTNLPYF